MIAGFLVTLVALTAGWQTALVFAICYFAYLQFEAYFISPRIMQKAVAVPGRRRRHLGRSPAAACWACSEP